MWVSKEKWDALVSKVNQLEKKLHAATHVSVYNKSGFGGRDDVPLNDYVKQMADQLNITASWVYPTYGHVVFQKKGE